MAKTVTASPRAELVVAETVAVHVANNKVTFPTSAQPCQLSTCQLTVTELGNVNLNKSTKFNLSKVSGDVK